jgi:myo-inositol catabolism protein IolC
VSCVVLERAANEEGVVHGLQQGAGVPGFVGFAVGRTIWWEPLKRWVVSAKFAADIPSSRNST